MSTARDRDASTQAHGAPDHTDPFGPRGSAGVWRRLAGVGVAGVVPAGVIAVVAPELLPWTALAVLLALVAGTGISLRMSTHVASVRRAHALVGAGLGVVFAAWSAWWLPDVSTAVLLALLAAGVGALVAILAVRVALALPAHLVRRVAFAGLAGTTVIVAAGGWILIDPTRGTDLVEVAATDEVEEAYGDGEGLAEAIAEGYAQRLDVGLPVLGGRAWVDVVGDVLDRPLGDTQLRVRTTPNLDLPEDPETGETQRLVTVVVRDREPDGCVVVKNAEIEVYDRVCHDLD
jgi:hypothetical protein